MSDVNPEAVRMDGEDYARGLERPRLRTDCWFQVVITNAEWKVAKTGNEGIGLQIAPVDSEGNAQTKLAVRENLWLSSSSRFTRHRLFVAMGKVKRYPKWDKKQNANIDADGNILDAKENFLVRGKIDIDVDALFAQYRNSYSDLIGETFFAKFKDKPSDDGRVFTEIATLAEEPYGDDTEVEYEDFTQEPEVDDGLAAELEAYAQSKFNGSNGKAKPAKPVKKATKKRK